MLIAPNGVPRRRTTFGSQTKATFAYLLKAGSVPPTTTTTVDFNSELLSVN